MSMSEVDMVKEVVIVMVRVRTHSTYITKDKHKYIVYLSVCVIVYVITALGYEWRKVVAAM